MMNGVAAVLVASLAMLWPLSPAGAQAGLRVRASGEAMRPVGLLAAASPSEGHDAAQQAQQAAAVPPRAAKPATGPQAIAMGHQLFNDNCEHCHGPDAVEGIEQRNLRHLSLRYGNKMDQVFLHTVTHGRPTQGMPNWSGILAPVQFRQILAFLHSVQEH
jgi:mono/diheme cytochrome c family protein